MMITKVREIERRLKADGIEFNYISVDFGDTHIGRIGNDKSEFTVFTDESPVSIVVSDTDWSEENNLVDDFVNHVKSEISRVRGQSNQGCGKSNCCRNVPEAEDKILEFYDPNAGNTK
ncbi:hypothetical protein N9137_01055 [Pseudomonadales bacterium]|nr:hypothetical protein [Pseudomonadales bacterium]